MDDMASKSGIAKLDLDNYYTWVVQVKCWLAITCDERTGQVDQ